MAASSRARSSSAAGAENVSTRIRSGSTPWSTSQANRATSVRVCREAARRLKQILVDAPTTAERAEEAGRGEAGDRSLVIDRAAEAGVFSLLDELHDDGHRFTAISEERGEVDYGDPGVRVVIDPIDGSLNAKRNLPHHAISIAVADGPTMADVTFAYVYDFGRREEWVARRDQG